MPGFAIVSADDVDDAYAGSDVPGEFRRLTDALGAEQVVRVSPGTARSHRNEGEEPVEIWVISVKGHRDATKIDDFWDASPAARQTR